MVYKQYLFRNYSQKIFKMPSIKAYVWEISCVQGDQIGLFFTN
jgi:hypothetical protein